MSTPVTELVTIPDVREHLNLVGVAASSQDDGELQGFIDAATAYIQGFTGPIIGQTFTEVHNGGGPIICLRNPPVIAVTSVVEYVAATGYTLTQVALGDATGAYAFSLDSAMSGVLRRRYNGGLAGSFQGGAGNIVVTYTAGHAAVSGDIRMAVLQDIAGLYQPSQLGPSSSMFPNSLNDGNGPLNPIGMFPRVAEIMSTPVMRTPSIA